MSLTKEQQKDLRMALGSALNALLEYLESGFAIVFRGVPGSSLEVRRRQILRDWRRREFGDVRARSLPPGTTPSATPRRERLHPDQLASTRCLPSS